MLIAQTDRELEAAQLLSQLHEGGDGLLVLFVVAIGDVALHILKTAVPAGVGILLSNFYLPFPNRMGHEKLLCHQSAARQGVRVHVAVFILVTQFLLMVAVALVTIGIVGIEVDSELSYFTRVVEIRLVLGCRVIIMESQGTWLCE